jgi:hypothetical protein
MRKYFLVIAILAALTAKASFNDWFTDKTLRVDYIHSGDSKSENYAIDQVKTEPFWGGSKTALIDNMGFGKYSYRVFDCGTNELIYSRGYCSLFGEWQSTEEARQTRRAFSESIIMPFPKKDVRVEFYSMNSLGKYEMRFQYKVAVNSIFINPEIAVYPVYEACISGSSDKKVDIVIVPDGYSADEMEKFKSDCDALVKNFFIFEPYKKNRDKFNFRAVLAPSPESGTDNPGKNIFKRTLLNTSYYTTNSERYLMTPDLRLVRDVAANAPYDQVIIMINSTKYGGGAIFNFYNTVINANASSVKIAIHEFGHGFAGLADEYDDGSTSYNDMYPLNVEPWEPNITTLVDFGHKWKKMLPENCSIPTPLTAESKGKIGVYEGAGYVAKGIYRPQPDCLMRTFNGNEFCPVCQNAIQKMIDFYCE